MQEEEVNNEKCFETRNFRATGKDKKQLLRFVVAGGSVAVHSLERVKIQSGEFFKNVHLYHQANLYVSWFLCQNYE
jgi:hypothetical protein